MTKGVSLALGLVLGVLATASPALAQDESEARMHFRLGRAYHDSGRFAEAAHEFEEAYRLSPDHPELLYNIFVAHRDAGNLPPAAAALREYLDRVSDIENRDQLVARLASMDRVIASQVSRDSPSGPNGSGATAGGAEAPSGTGGGGGLWTPGFVIAGIGAAAIVAGVVTGVLTLDAQAQLEADYACTPEGVCNPGFEDAASSGSLLAGLTDGLLFGGLAVGAVGLLLALVISDGGAPSETARFDVGCGPTGCAASLQGQF